MKLDRHSSIPLYAQLRELIVERIQDGTYQIGEKIPSEMAFCKELDLSRPTVRQAIADLVADNVLTIEKGKGTYVAYEPERICLEHFDAMTFSFLNFNTYEGVGLKPIKLVEPDRELDKLFELNPDQAHPGYWLAEWSVKNANDVLGVCQSYVPVQFFPELGQSISIGKRMVDIKSNKYAYLPQKGSLTLTCRPALNREAKALEIPRRSFIIALDGPLYSRSGHVSEVLRLAFNPELIELELN